MLQIFKSQPDKNMVSLQDFEPNCWVNLVAPTQEELLRVTDALGADPAFLRAALDDEESSRVDADDGQSLIIVDFPRTEKEDANGADGVIYSTLPLGILVLENAVITVSLEEFSVIKDLAAGAARGINTAYKSNFILQLLLRLAKRYLSYLRQIDKISHYIEKQLHKSMRNKELFQLLELEKSLVYFTTSLASVDRTLKKITAGRLIKLYPEDDDLLDDVRVEIAQAIEMAQIYSSILTGTMDAFASVISNNLNIVMKILTSLTVLLTIPNVIFSFYGMNVTGLPAATVWTPAVIAAVITLGSWILLRRKNLI